MIGDMIQQKYQLCKYLVDLSGSLGGPMPKDGYRIETAVYPEMWFGTICGSGLPSMAFHLER